MPGLVKVVKYCISGETVRSRDTLKAKVGEGPARSVFAYPEPPHPSNLENQTSILTLFLCKTWKKIAIDNIPYRELSAL
jgi:hypothetical protein